MALVVGIAMVPAGVVMVTILVAVVVKEVHQYKMQMNRAYATTAKGPVGDETKYEEIDLSQFSAALEEDGDHSYDYPDCYHNMDSEIGCDTSLAVDCMANEGGEVCVADSAARPGSDGYKLDTGDMDSGTVQALAESGAAQRLN